MKVMFALLPPLFQADFPYEREGEAQVTRREFCNFLGLTSAALFVGAAGFAAKAAIDARESVSYRLHRLVALRVSRRIPV